MIIYLENPRKKLLKLMKEFSKIRLDTKQIY